MSSPIPVVVAGALGRMGAEVINAVVNAEDCQLVGATDLAKICGPLMAKGIRSNY